MWFFHYPNSHYAKQSNRICPSENKKTRYLLILSPLLFFHFLEQQLEVSLLAQFSYFQVRKTISRVVADLSNVTRLIKEKRSLSALYQVYFKSIVFRQDSYSKSILNSLQDQLLPEGAICKNLRRTNRRIMGPKALSIFNLKMETSNKILVL